MELTIRPMGPEERLYCYTQSSQIMAQTGCIGHLRADMGTDGRCFYSDWDDHMSSLKTDPFKSELDDVINALRFDRKYGGMLKDRRSLAAFCRSRPEGAFDTDKYDYGYRVDTEKYVYMFRLNPNPGLYNVYCYCYVREWLDRHLARAKQGIRFITPDYKERFRIPDGGTIRSILPDGRRLDEVSRLGRSTKNLIELVELFQAKGVQLVSLKESIDTSTPSGKLLFTLMSAIAQFERDTIAERTAEGLKAARAKGHVGGRPRTKKENLVRALRLYTTGEYTLKEIEELTGVKKSTLYRYMKEHAKDL